VEPNFPARDDYVERDKDGVIIPTPRSLRGFRRDWIYRYRQDCLAGENRLSATNLGAVNRPSQLRGVEPENPDSDPPYRPSWADAPLEGPLTDYAEEDTILYPPWTVELASAMLNSFMLAAGRPLSRHLDPTQFAELFLDEAVESVTREHPAEFLPIKLIEFVAGAISATGLTATKAAEWAGGMCAGVQFRPPPGVFIEVTSRADSQIPIHYLGLAIFWSRVAHSLRGNDSPEEYPTWWLFVNSHPTQPVEDYPEHLHRCGIAGACYRIEETLNAAGAQRVARLCLAVLNGQRILPTPRERGYGSSVTDMMQGVGSVIAALTSTVTLILQARQNGKKDGTSRTSRGRSKPKQRKGTDGRRKRSKKDRRKRR
jgi:hypothetical protein